ncbi:MAG: hypothetical protein AAB872_00770 [Patescibacteria group bacterium]
MNLKTQQLKTLSEFSNMVAVAWFTGGIVSPIFAEPSQVKSFVILAMFETLLFLSGSVYLVKDYNNG